MRIMIVGAGGGIGSALLEKCMEAYPFATFEATYLSNKPEFEAERVSWHRLDVTDERQVEELSHQFSQIDWIINCVGLLHCQHHGPEKSIKQLDADFFIENFRRNTLPTLLLAKYFQDKLMSSNQTDVAKFVTLSARVGSIEDNRLGGWYSYRASKSALNMALKNLRNEWQRSHKPIAVLALHPGTTDTQLSEPFQRNLPEGQLMTPMQTAHLLLEQIDALDADSSGTFKDYAGETIPW
ncbi:SDR family oxidoreductase [Vibrio breoganii]|uniref:SDR family oxidoreductase n=1 Tax=Vibrio breoganii TaxID=553239 RepID=UPI000C849567|nr:SDR family oxidoreductase [Vibrio breoganii]PMH17063.1 short chain dehydrogenase [Vibrio breoganii]PMM16652.1 short chain dehydrogenase [Vibrio breoganii]TKG14644.1 SDR family oxidoreductase [Vibrio breoganii]